MPPDVDTSSRYAHTPYGQSTYGRSILIALFILSLLIPIRPEIAGLRLDPYRLLLLIMFVPLLVKLFSGRAGYFTSSDGFLILFMLWSMFIYLFHHGVEKLAYALITNIEILGGYLAGRLLIRSDIDYRRFIRFFMIALLLMFPLAVFELITFRIPISEMFGKFTTVIPKSMDARYGLSRVQGPFPHAIHFGLFCSVTVANIYYLYSGSMSRVLPLMGLALSMVAMSLSSAPLLAALLQIMIIIWGKLTGRRWRLLIILTVSAYVIIDLLSNRGPIIILIETMTINSRTGWWRVHIWNYGSQSVLNHPFFGIGLNDWVRPYWLDVTVDNFWLVIAMRFGFPGIILFALALAIHIYRIVRLKTLNAAQKALRTGYIVSLTGILFTLSTVHLWDAMNVVIMFYIGAGAFLYTSSSGEQLPSSGPKNLEGPTVRIQGAHRNRSLPFSRSTNRGIHQSHTLEEQ